MEIQKQKDLYLAKLLEQEVIKQDEFEDLVFKAEINAFHSNYLSSRFMDNINFGWSAWQAAKAQAVPEWFEIGRLQDRITELLDERQELYAQLDAGSTEGFILVEKDLVQSIHQSCVKCLDIDLPPIFRATVCTIRDEVAPLIEAQEPTND